MKVTVRIWDTKIFEKQFGHASLEYDEVHVNFLPQRAQVPLSSLNFSKIGGEYKSGEDKDFLEKYPPDKTITFENVSVENINNIRIAYQAFLLSGPSWSIFGGSIAERSSAFFFGKNKTWSSTALVAFLLGVGGIKLNLGELWKKKVDLAVAEIKVLVSFAAAQQVAGVALLKLICSESLLEDSEFRIKLIKAAAAVPDAICSLIFVTPEDLKKSCLLALEDKPSEKPQGYCLMM